MRRRLSFLALAACLVVAGCCKRLKPAAKEEKPEIVPQTPIALGAEPAWPLPEAAGEERIKDRRPGTSGDFVLSEKQAPKLPVRGALVPWHDGSTSFRTHRPFAAAPVGEGDWFLVLADSGIWLLESETMAVRARVVAYGTGDLAASADGKRFAYGRCDATGCFVEIRAFPGMEIAWSMPAHEPSRLRFSPDGTLLAAASARGDSATVMNIEKKTAARLQAGNDVNDALVLSAEKKWIAYGTDSDVAVIQNWETEAFIFSTQAAMMARTKRGFDQNAMAYDPKKDEWLVGGNDDVVWRFGGISTGAPYYVGRAGFANDVEDIVILANGDVLVGLDCGSIDVWRADGSRSEGVGKSVGLSSWGARLSLDAKGNVLAVLGGTVLRWKAGESLVKQSPFFGWSADWEKSYTKSDVVLLGRSEGASFSYVVQRASLKAADPLSVEARPIGEISFETHSPEVLLLDDGTRLFLGKGSDEKLRMFRLPLGGDLSPAQDTSVPYGFTARVLSADGKRFGVESGRVAAEVDDKGARVLGTLKERESLVWSSKKGVWQACYGRACRPFEE